MTTATTKPLCTIVGMGPGVSMSVARRFGKEGFAVAMVARKKESLERHAQDLAGHGIEALGYKADAGDEHGLTKALDEIQTHQGKTSVLVYNAAILRQELASRTTFEDYVEDFRVNVAGAVTAVQHVLPDMKAEKKGTILFTGGGLALQPYAQFASLAIGKSGIRNLCFSLAGELRPLGIHVATVTICGIVKAGGKFDPALIADEYWNLHAQNVAAWEQEKLFQ